MNDYTKPQALELRMSQPFKAPDSLHVNLIVTAESACSMVIVRCMHKRYLHIHFFVKLVEDVRRNSAVPSA